MDPGRKHETSGTEIKVFITHGTSSNESISISFSLSPSHMATQMDPDGSLHRKWGALQKRDLEFRKPESFIMDSKHAYALP